MALPIKPSKDYLFVIDQSKDIEDVFILQKIIYTIVKHKNSVVAWPLEEYVRDNIINHLENHEHVYYYSTTNNEVASIVNAISNGYSFTKQMLTLDFKNYNTFNQKYESAGCDISDWADYFVFRRNKDREEKLFTEFLGLRDNTEYAIVNKYYSYPLIKSENMDNLYLDIPHIEMREIPNFTIFDWCLVLEKAKQIHTVENYIFHLVEKLDVKAELFGYSRNNQDVTYYPYFKKNWRYIS